MKFEIPRYRQTLLFVRVFWELLRYDVVLAMSGFPGIYKGLTRKVHAQKDREQWESTICKAVDIVSACYWKRVLCLQRSVITARVLQAHGIDAEVVIGYGFAPFVSHAWVEVDRRVVNDLSGYQAQLRVLDRIRPEAANRPLVLQS
jgi:hypothetical protein